MDITVSVLAVICGICVQITSSLFKRFCLTTSTGSSVVSPHTDKASAALE
ncbi:hypothetical protein JZU46_02925 [bacterium]|nr:hypothetical protein [bacterium]